MRWQYVLHIIGALVACIGLTMIFPLAWGLYYSDGTAIPMAQSLAITVVSGALLFFIFRNPESSKSAMTHREGMAIVALGWFVAGAFGGLPFYLGGTFETVVDCVFESLSGFSTTGSSVLTNIEAVPRGKIGRASCRERVFRAV